MPISPERAFEFLTQNISRDPSKTVSRLNVLTYSMNAILEKPSATRAGGSFVSYGSTDGVTPEQEPYSRLRETINALNDQLSSKRHYSEIPETNPVDTLLSLKNFRNALTDIEATDPGAQNFSARKETSSLMLNFKKSMGCRSESETYIPKMYGGGFSPAIQTISYCKLSEAKVFKDLLACLKSLIDDIELKIRASIPVGDEPTPVH